MNQDCSPSLKSHRHQPFRVIPVIDLLGGRAVHAVGGRRAHYQPIQSILHRSSDPVGLARSFKNALASDLIYLADLDAIGGRAPAVGVYQQIIDAGIHLWIDSGVRNLASLVHLRALDPASFSIVAGLETIDGPRALTDLVKDAGPSRVIFSLDLFDGIPRTSSMANWGTSDPLEIAEAAIDCGAHQLLLLDLARVGTSRGIGTHQLMVEISVSTPALSLYVGGGISRIEEIAVLRDAGATAILVGSAIHDGRIGARELASLNGSCVREHIR